MASQKKNTPAQKNKLNKKTKKTIVTVSVIAMAALILGGTLLAVFLGNQEDYKKLAADRKTVATCNGFEIPYEELRFLSKLYKDSLEYAYGEGIWDDPATAEQYRDELETLVMENLNENYLILSACKTLSIKIDSSDQKEYVNKEMKTLLDSDFGGKEDEMRKWIEEQGMTESYLRFCIGVEYLQSVIYYTLLDAGWYTYDVSNIDAFMEYVMTSENYARTIHVFVSNDEGDDIDANRQKAQTMYEHLIAEGDVAEREKLMRTYIGSANNDDLQITGDGYYFTYGEMEKAYEEATFALEENGVSEVVETSDGFYVIMRLAPDDKYVTLHAQTLLSYYQSAAMGAYIESYDETCQVVFNDYGKSLDLLNLE
ncbi:MAG: peptidylprolyl isomerase [Clostridia bacterium]|nr:peptidylprolyl isomerase [Clostridia bacterium]